jgi:hypothetical protein
MSVIFMRVAYRNHPPRATFGLGKPYVQYLRNCLKSFANVAEQAISYLTGVFLAYTENFFFIYS